MPVCLSVYLAYAHLFNLTARHNYKEVKRPESKLPFTLTIDTLLGLRTATVLEANSVRKTLVLLDNF
jgi:hypothetical protein